MKGYEVGQRLIAYTLFAYKHNVAALRYNGDSGETGNKKDYQPEGVRA